MGKRKSYPSGTFSWVDLAAIDAPASKVFYSGLFGWEMEDNDAGGGAVYTTCRIDDDAACGLFEMSEDMRATGVRPHWTSYVTVPDAHAAAARAKQLGGAVIDDAFDVLDVGRMAVLKDPQGAVLALWQPGTRIGAERVNDVGCLCMNEPSGDAPDGPTMVFNGRDINAAIFAAPEGTPPHWRPCFTVASTEATRRAPYSRCSPGRWTRDRPHGTLIGGTKTDNRCFAYRSIRGSPKSGKTVLSANHVIAEIWSPSSVRTTSPYGRAISVCGLGR